MERNPEDYVALTDGEGGELLFEILDVINYLGDDYAVLLPAEDDAADDEVTILRLIPGDNDDEETLVGVDDPAVLDAVFALFAAKDAE